MYSSVHWGCHYADVASVMLMRNGSKLTLSTTSHSKSALLELKVTQHFSRRYMDEGSVCYIVLANILSLDNSFLEEYCRFLPFTLRF